jgi:hypothetical protein
LTDETSFYVVGINALVQKTSRFRIYSCRLRKLMTRPTVIVLVYPSLAVKGFLAVTFLADEFYS